MLALQKDYGCYVSYVGEHKNSPLHLFVKPPSFVYKHIPLFNRSIIRQYYATKKFEKYLDLLVKYYNIDIIITQLEYTPCAVKVAKDNGIKSVVFIQNYDHFCPFLFMDRDVDCNNNCFKCSPFVYKLQYPWIKGYLKMHKEALINADLVFSDSRFVKDLLFKKYSVDSIVFNPVLNAEDMKVEENSKRYVTFINPIKTKGVELIKKLVIKMPYTDFLIVGGDGKQFVHKMRLPDNIRIIPWCDNMKQVYSQTKLLLVPSIWPEPFGRVVTEAIFNGIPCIVSNKGGLSEAVGEGGYVIKDIHNIDEWIEKIRRLDSDIIYQRVSDNAKKHAKNYTYKKQMNKFNKYFKEAKK